MLLKEIAIIKEEVHSKIDDKMTRENAVADHLIK